MPSLLNLLDLRILTILDDPHKPLRFRWLLTANVSAMIARGGQLGRLNRSFDVT